MQDQPAISSKPDEPVDLLLSNDLKNTSKRLKQETIVITECLTRPCPEMYTDSIFGSIQIVCRSPSHVKKKGSERIKLKETRTSVIAGHEGPFSS
jgi:hypothetical protein